ncbi:hypothetical protein [Mycolicibacterium gilvum]|uniref:hypothetical protein n=1 Tax=Mycolicibacterium gilvum TaxID=1804 RepID=UPI0011C063E5|nr:hypothetical protein [Mycolicibacterium gilvum]MCV7057274.1 hypothetical protein [Mycolicibacterium gilvum]
MLVSLDGHLAAHDRWSRIAIDRNGLPTYFFRHRGRPEAPFFNRAIFTDIEFGPIDLAVGSFSRANDAKRA